jgi:hypothetical protein
MQHQLLSRFELHFWNFTIRALSQSNFMRAALRRVYAIANTSDSSALATLMAASGLAGLVCGYLAYFLTQAIR